MKPAGTFVISLDFELMWGMFDKVSLQDYGENLRGVHTAIPRTLKLFEKYDIHATWATVGMLLYSDKQRLAAALPSQSDQPHYANQSLSAYEHLYRSQIDDQDQHYFAPDLVKKIIKTPYQELASHTFAHYYCLEDGGNDHAFTADCQAMTKAAAQFNQTLNSLVFPRNQWSTEALDTITTFGFTSYRGTENHFIYQARNEASKTNLVLRSLRFLDRYLNLTGHHTYSAPTPINRSNDSLINVPASRQLHPYSKKLSFLERLKLRRIKTGMTRAAKRGEIFHLWWHPHNFGINQTENFAALTEILEHYQQLKQTHNFASKTMHEVATKTS